MQSVSKAHRHFENVAERIKRLRSRPLAITKTGDPDEKTSFAVHTCYATGFKPQRCGCTERVSISTALKLNKDEKAKWVRILKRDGSVYTWTRAIVLTGVAKLGPTTEPADIVQVVTEQIEIQNAYAAEREAQALERIRKKQRRRVRALILKFRKQLTPEENNRCFDDQTIIEALQIKDISSFVESLAGELEANPSELGFLKTIRQRSRIGAAVLEAQIHYWNIVLAAEGLTMNAGKHFENAPTGCGLIVTGGYGRDRIEKVESFREANQDGKRRVTAANFVPDSGDAFDNESIYNAGQEPDVFETSNDDEARRQEQAKAGLDAFQINKKSERSEIEADEIGGHLCAPYEP